MKKTLLLICGLALLSVSCSTNPYRTPGPHGLLDDRFGTRYLAQELYLNLNDPEVMDAPMVVTTFVDLNNLDKTSILGRVMAEKLLDEMNRRGFEVVEVRRSQDLFIKKSVGELILTRDTAELFSNTEARAVLAGTYVATVKALIVNARLIDVATPKILSSVSYEVAMTEEIQNLITGIPPF